MSPVGASYVRRLYGLPYDTCPSETREPLRNPSPGGTRPKSHQPGVDAEQAFPQAPERPFLSSESDRTTILLGGLTRRHEHFIKAVFEGSGYSCEILPSPDQDAFQVGKEYGNNGQCSPAYFTAGSLIKFLKDLEDGGM